MAKKNKKRFEVRDNESIDQCLERINNEGYTPVRRAEEPIFQEVVHNGEKNLEPVGRIIVFHAVKD
ncbi:NETI motif-containing protein [Halobacillus hunanensis]|uniref:NETI motif-containing protein n=1 Tax=Halobacillus hunanensis TaxID=578214 RepID=UPI0009A6224F|nr:NETI motif-containing protein [Halobacillus hunanensis]